MPVGLEASLDSSRAVLQSEDDTIDAGEQRGLPIQIWIIGYGNEGTASVIYHVSILPVSTVACQSFVQFVDL